MKSITFKLRKGIKFHDGSELNAEVVKWNIDIYIESKRISSNWTSAEIIDDYTVRVNFIDWMNTMPSSFAENAGGNVPNIYSKAAFDKNGKDWMRSNPVGTGPFKFVEFKQDESFKAEKNPDYWVTNKPYLDAIEFSLIGDPLLRNNVMLAGQADMTTSYENVLQKESTFKAAGLVVNKTIGGIMLLAPDSANSASPWSNPKVREAAEYGIDRDSIARAFGYGYYQAPYQLIPRNTLAYNPDFAIGRKYDQEKAKQLLAEAGYATGLKTTIIVAPFGSKDVPAAIQGSLAQIGITAELKFVEIGEWVTYMGPGKWPENSALYFTLSLYDPYFIGGLQFLFDMLGQSWLKNENLLQAYKAALTSPSSDVKLVQAVTDTMTKDALFIPICDDDWGRVVKPDVVVGFLERANINLFNPEAAWLNR